MIAATGVGIAMPGVSDAAQLLATSVRPDEEVVPAALLGKKGLRYKDRATQLGLCAAQLALRDAGLHAEGALTVDGAGVALVVSSNLGNVDTVCRVTRTIADEGGTRGVSPMDTPNASSNIIASEIAIRFGLRGPALMMCNGASSGLDAVRWAATLLRAGRASQVLVVGVEPDNEIVRELVGAERVVDGGAALVLESTGSAAERGVAVRAEIGAHARKAGVAECLASLTGSAALPSAWFVPDTAAEPPAELLAGVRRYDLARTWGATSGALGLLQCAGAIGWFEGGGDGSVLLVSGADDDDASAGLLMHAPAVAGSA